MELCDGLLLEHIFTDEGFRYLVFQEFRCDLGQWIHGKGQAHPGNFPGFTALLEHHKMFHYAASNVVALSHAGKEAEAQKMLEGPFAGFSKAVGEDLKGMHYAVEHSRAHKR